MPCCSVIARATFLSYRTSQQQHSIKSIILLATFYTPIRIFQKRQTLLRFTVPSFPTTLTSMMTVEKTSFTCRARAALKNHLRIHTPAETISWSTILNSPLFCLTQFLWKLPEVEPLTQLSFFSVCWEGQYQNRKESFGVNGRTSITYRFSCRQVFYTAILETPKVQKRFPQNAFLPFTKIEIIRFLIKITPTTQPATENENLIITGIYARHTLSGNHPLPKSHVKTRYNNFSDQLFTFHRFIVLAFQFALSVSHDSILPGPTTAALTPSTDERSSSLIP